MSLIKSNRWILLLLICALFLFMTAASNTKRKIIKIIPSLESNTVKLQQQFTLELKVSVVRPWHINTDKPQLKFLIPTKVEFGPEDHIELVSVSYPKGKKRRISCLKKTIRTLDGTFVIKCTLKLLKPLDPETKLSGTLIYQACTDRSCLPPDKLNFTVPKTIVTP